jgi:gliding motility-associated-like protein
LKLNPKYSILFCCFFNVLVSFAMSGIADGDTNKLNFVRNADIFGSRVFVENKGQYNNKSKDSVFFGLEHGFERIFFTNKGLVYELVEMREVTEEEMEAQQQGKPLKELKKTNVYMNWVGAGHTNIRVEASEKQSHYFTFGEAKYNSNTFKKITYKNVYKNIDIEYTIPEDKPHGIKYSLILHPGANPEDVKILYSGDVSKIKQTKDGEIQIKTSFDDLMEHAPQSFVQNHQEVASEFKLNKDTIGFVFPLGYPKEETLVVDPWVAAITTLSNNNYGYDVDYDFMGNVYVYGGNTNSARCKVAKYNSSGTLLWTFSGVVISPSFDSGSGWSSNFKVNKGLSKIYIGRNTGTPNAIRLDASGNYDNLISNGSPAIGEVWNLEFTCNGDLLIFGGAFSSFEYVSTTTGSISLVSTFNPTITGCCQDVVSVVVDGAGHTFVYFLGHNLLSYKIALISSPSYTNTIWLASSTFSVLAYLQNKNLYVNANAGSAVAFNALAVNNNYLYYYDGLNLAAFDKTNGSLLGSTTMSGLTGRQQGGIAVDDCDNVYVGGVGSVLSYNYNNGTFTQLTSITLSATSTYQYVYDVQLNKLSNTIYVSGSGFVGSYSAINSLSCAMSTLNPCNFGQGGVTASSSSITCANLGSATVQPIGGIGPWSYTWMPISQTGSVVTGLSPGMYTVIVADQGSNYTYSQVTIFTPLVPLTANVNNSAVLNCYGATYGTAAIANLAGGSGNQSYSWTNGTTTYTTPTASNLGAGNYTATVTDALTGCVFSQTFSILQPSSMFLIVAASSPTACVGTSLTVWGANSGGSPPYTYSWTTGPPTDTYAVTSAIAGNKTYTLVSTDNAGCPISAPVTVTFVPNPVLSTSNISICPLQVGTLSISGATTYTWNGSQTGSSFTASPTSTQQYSVIGTALACTTSAYPSIIVKPIPIPFVTSNSPRCNGDQLSVSASGGASYNWTGPSAFIAAIQNPLINSISLAQAGVYNVTVTAVNNCTAATSTSVVVHPTPTLSAVGSTVCSNGTLTLGANSFPGSGFAWNGPLNYSSNQQNPFIVSPNVNRSGTYTVKVTSAVGCTNTAVAQVTVTQLPTPNIISNSPKCEGFSLNFFGAGGDSYQWTGPNGFISNSQTPVINNVTALANGIYNLQVTTGPCVASTSASVTVYALPQPQAFNTGPVCDTKSISIYVNVPPVNPIIDYSWTGPAGFTNQFPGIMISNSGLSHNGIYMVTVTDSHSCQASATTTVTVMQNPTLTAEGATVCLNRPAVLSASGAVSYWWTGPQYYQSPGATPTVQSVSLNKEGIYTVVGTAPNTCTSVTTVQVKTRSLPTPSLYALPKTEICLTETITLTGAGGIRYQWYGPDNLYYEENPVRLVFNHPVYAGIYTLVVTDTAGCFNQTIVPITVHSLPNGSLKGLMQGCDPLCSEYKFYPEGSSVTISSAWQVEKSAYTKKQFDYCFIGSGTHTITGNFYDSLTACKNQIKFLVDVYTKPVADFIFSPTNPVEGLDEVTFINASQGEDIYKWSWFFVNNKEQKREGRQASYLFSNAGIYPIALVVRDARGCADTIVKTVQVQEDFLVFVPNSFTPNDDGLNETFIPVLKGVKFFRFSIFDRWGEKIFETQSPDQGWDGTYKDQQCKQDIYVWKMTVSSKNGQNKELQGNVTLHR